MIRIFIFNVYFFCKFKVLLFENGICYGINYIFEFLNLNIIIEFQNQNYLMKISFFNL